MENELLKKSLSPIINKNSKILILGSLPSDKSLEIKEYYSNTNNRFWDIVGLIYKNNQDELKNKSYIEKTQFLYKHYIALWDIYKEAKRKGNDDKNIIESSSKTNDLEFILKKYKNIRTILFNGAIAEKKFKQYLRNEDFYNLVNERKIKCYYVPSSSGSNTKYTTKQKAEIWRRVIFE